MAKSSRHDIKIRLGRKDACILKWFELSKESDIFCSDVALAAVEYYSRTGTYMNIGNVHIFEKNTRSVIKTICVSENSPAYKWLVSRSEANNKGISTILKKVLRLSISCDDAMPEFVISDDDAYFRLEDVLSSSDFSKGNLGGLVVSHNDTVSSCMSVSNVKREVVMPSSVNNVSNSAAVENIQGNRVASDLNLDIAEIDKEYDDDDFSLLKSMEDLDAFESNLFSGLTY